MDQKRGLFNRYFFPRDGNPEHFQALDGLRGIAVLIVMLSHASGMDMHLFNILNLRQAGKSGVFLFFILSAYLLDRQIALAIKNNKANMRYWLNYLFRRFMRIYPLFFAALLFNYWLRVQGTIYGLVVTGWDDIFQHLILQKERNIGIFWSIAVEFKYYFISPLIVIFINRFVKWNVVNVTLLLFCVMSAVTFLTASTKSSKVSTFTFLPIFLVGTVISLVEVFSNAFDNMTKDDKKRLNIIGLIAVLIFVMTIRSVYQFIIGSPKYNLAQSALYIPYALIWGVILIAAKYSEGIFHKILCFKPLRFIGVISFSLYLFHWPVMKFAGLSGHFDESIQVYVYLLLSILLSTITFILIEKPFSKLKLRNRANDVSLKRELSNE